MLYATGGDSETIYRFIYLHRHRFEKLRPFQMFSFCFSCERGDFLKLFLHLERPEVNEYTPWSGLLCGGFTDIPHVLYSSGPGLVLEFHTDRRTSNASGFLGHFRFIDRREYKAFSNFNLWKYFTTHFLFRCYISKLPVSASLILKQGITNHTQNSVIGNNFDNYKGNTPRWNSNWGIWYLYNFQTRVFTYFQHRIVWKVKK